MSACPHCGQDGEVKDSRSREGWRWRRRDCPVHGSYSTMEISADDWARLNAALKASEAERRKIARVLPILERLAGK